MTVGGQAPSDQGGFNGGGDSGHANSGFGGGGGASDIRIGGTTLKDRVLVAGGGGGQETRTAITPARSEGTAVDCPGGRGLRGVRFTRQAAAVPKTAGGSATPQRLRDASASVETVTPLLPAAAGAEAAGTAGAAASEGGGGGGSSHGPPGTRSVAGVRSGDGRVTIQYGTTLCNGRPATIVGTEKSDKLRGTNGADVIAALGGDDRVRASRAPTSSAVARATT